MIVFRYMSFKEFELLKQGKTLTNTTDHSQGHHTTSKGFCFFDEDDCSPEYAYEFLSDIVSDEICARFEVDEPLLTKSYGIYADPDPDTTFLDMLSFSISKITMTEYCCESYNRNTFKILNYRRYNSGNWSEWRELKGSK